MRFGTKISGLIVAFLAVGYQCYAQSSQGQSPSNIASTLYAANFANWTVPQGNNGPFSWSSSQVCTSATSGGATFKPFVVGTPILIRDTATPSNSEIVTPTAVNITGSGCSITVNPAHQHYSFYLTTATAGLQDAINYAIQNLGSGTALVLVTPAWAQLGGTTAMITPGAQGNTSISILDERSSVILPYIWQSTLYVAQPFAAGGSGVQQLLAGAGIGLSPLGGTGVVTVTNTGLTGLTTTGASGPSIVSAGVINVPTYCGTGSAACFLLGGTSQTVTQSPTFGNTTAFTLCPTSSSAVCNVDVNTPGGSNTPFIGFLPGGDINFSSPSGGLNFIAASGHGFGFSVGPDLILSSDDFGTLSARSISNDFPSFIVNPGTADVGSALFYFATCQHTFCSIGMTPEVPDLQVTLAGVTEVKDNAGNAAIVCNQVDGCGSATNLAGGAANDIPYQTGAGATSFITPVANAVLVTNSSGVPSESATLPSGIGTTTQPYTDSSTNIATTKFVSNTVGYVPPSGSTVWYLDFGDSRVAGSQVTSGNAPTDYLATMSHFNGKMNIVKLGYPGQTACQIFAAYTTTAHAYAVNGTTRTAVIIHNAMGVNDILQASSDAAPYGCIKQIIAAEQADGMTVIQDTVYSIATAPLEGVNQPSWFPGSLDSTCIPVGYAWPVGTQYNTYIQALNNDLKYQLSHDIPGVWTIDWAGQVQDMWQQSTSCDGIHTTGALNKYWAQFVNDAIGVGPSIASGQTQIPKYVTFDFLFLGNQIFVDNQGNINTTAEANLGGVDVTGGAPSYAAQGINLSVSSGQAFIDATGTSTSNFGTFNFRQVTLNATSDFCFLCSDTSGNAVFHASVTGTQFTDSGLTSSPCVSTTSGGLLQSGCSTLAPLASPALTGTPTSPTASPGTNTTQIASTAFVAAAIGTLSYLQPFPSSPVTFTPGTNITSVTCVGTCDVNGGEITVVGGALASTGTFATMNYSTLGAAPRTYVVTMNGSATYLGLGHGTPGTTTTTFTSAISLAAVTFTMDYAVVK